MMVSSIFLFYLWAVVEAGGSILNWNQDIFGKNLRGKIGRSYNTQDTACSIILMPVLQGLARLARLSCMNEMIIHFFILLVGGEGIPAKRVG